MPARRKIPHRADRRNNCVIASVRRKSRGSPLISSTVLQDTVRKSRGESEGGNKGSTFGGAHGGSFKRYLILTLYIHRSSRFLPLPDNVGLFPRKRERGRKEKLLENSNGRREHSSSGGINLSRSIWILQSREEFQRPISLPRI